MPKFYYRIAGLDILIESDRINPLFLFNYVPFRVQEEEVSSLLFSVSFQELPEVKGKPSRSYQVDEMTLYIYLGKEGCDVLVHSEITGKDYRFCARAHWTQIEMDLTFDDKEEYGILNYCLMLAFIYSSSFLDTVLIHASCICNDKYGVAFIGHSGVGKSTHSRLWMQHIPGTSLLNDDQPAVRLIDGVAYIYGTPWSGKTHCYKNKRVRLNTLFLMEQADKNEITELLPFAAFRRLLGSCSMMQEERMTFNCIVRTLVAIAEKTPVYELKNKPEQEAVLLAYEHSIGKKTSK